MHVCPGYRPPPIRKLMYLRSILNSGEVSVPVVRSPSKKLFTSPWPRYPVTSIWSRSLPFAGPLPNACPVATHCP